MAVIVFLLASLSATVVASSCPPKLNTSQIRVLGIHQFYAVESHFPSGAVYSNKTVRSYLTCAIFCLQDFFCKSFNFCTGSKLCSLISEAHSEDTLQIQPSDGCYYFDETIHEVHSNAPCATYKKEPGKHTDIYGSNFPERIHLSIFTTGILRMTASYQGGYQYVEFQTSTKESRIWDGADVFENRTKVNEGISLDGSSRYWITFNNSKVLVGKYGTEDPLMTYTRPNTPPEESLGYRGISVWNQQKIVWHLYEMC